MPADIAPADARRCRAQPRPRRQGGLRPTDVVGAFFVCGIAFLLAAAAAGVVQWLDPWPQGRWLALHLAFVGGASQLVLGASRFLPMGRFRPTWGRNRPIGGGFGGLAGDQARLHRNRLR